MHKAAIAADGEEAWPSGGSGGRQLSTYMRTHRSPRSETELRIRGLYGIADAGAANGDPVALGLHLLEGGCRLVQLRCKGWAVEDVIVAGRILASRCHDVGATLVVNDWPEVAVAVDADGVHVGAEDGTTAEVRAIIGPERILGRSTNQVDAVTKAVAESDYVAFGPMYETPHLSRPKPVQGVHRLDAVRNLVPHGVPLVAIGGIVADRLAAVRAGGADAWAVIGAIATSPDPVTATRALLG